VQVVTVMAIIQTMARSASPAAQVQPHHTHARAISNTQAHIFTIAHAHAHCAPCSLAFPSWRGFSVACALVLVSVSSSAYHLNIRSESHMAASFPVFVRDMLALLMAVVGVDVAA